MVSKGVLIFTVLTATCSSQIIRYNINHHCSGGTGGVFKYDRLKNGRYMLSGENVQVIIFNRVDSDVELIISTTNFKKELNQIKIKVGFCPRLTIRGNIIKHITIEHANKECQYETSTTTVSRDNKRDKVQISTYQSNHGSTTSINKNHFDSTTMSVNNDIRQTSEHTTPVHSSSATARNDDSTTPVHSSTLTMRNDDSATMSGSNEGDKRQTSEYQHTTPVCPGTSTIEDGHHEETEKVKTYLVWLITITAYAALNWFLQRIGIDIPVIMPNIQFHDQQMMHRYLNQNPIQAHPNAQVIQNAPRHDPNPQAIPQANPDAQVIQIAQARHEPNPEAIPQVIQNAPRHDPNPQAISQANPDAQVIQIAQARHEPNPQAIPQVIQNAPRHDPNPQAIPQANPDAQVIQIALERHEANPEAIPVQRQQEHNALVLRKSTRMTKAIQRYGFGN